MNYLNIKKILIGIAVAGLMGVGQEMNAQTEIAVGKAIPNTSLRNLQRENCPIPGLGSKVVIVFYTDPDCRDVNDPLSAAVKEGGFEDRISGVGVANCADTWIPDGLIRQGALKKEKQFEGSVMLLDPDHRLKNAWGLGECNNVGVVIIVGPDARVKYVKPIGSTEESRKAIPEVLETIRKLVLPERP